MGERPWGRRYIYVGDYDQACLMAPLDTGINVCQYITIAAGISIVLTVAFIIYKGFQWCQGIRREQPAPAYSTIEFIIYLVGVCWWIGAGTTGTVYGINADHEGLEKKPARTAVWALCWVNVFLFTSLALLQIMAWCAVPRKPVTAPPIYFEHPFEGPSSTESPGSGGASLSPYAYPTLAAAPAQPVPPSPFISSASSVPSTTYGGYPLATQPPSRHIP